MRRGREGALRCGGSGARLQPSRVRGVWSDSLAAFSHWGHPEPNWVLKRVPKAREGGSPQIALSPLEGGAWVGVDSWGCSRNWALSLDLKILF